MRRKSDTKYVPGNVVRSNYRARWVGVVIESDGPLTVVVPMIDAAGHPQPRRRVHRLHEAWLEPATLEPEQINQTWLKGSKTDE